MLKKERTAFLDWLKDAKCDIIFLQEIHFVNQQESFNCQIDTNNNHKSLSVLKNYENILF